MLKSKSYDDRVYAEFPSGKYYIGDLCFGMADKYRKKLKQVKNSSRYQLKDNNENLLAIEFRTRWGDGTYLDQDKREYAVDSGGIGICTENCIDPEKIKQGFGHVFTFDESFTVTKERKDGVWEGVLNFGKVGIHTGILRVIFD
jgi:hypothetical protein